MTDTPQETDPIFVTARAASSEANVNGRILSRLNWVTDIPPESAISRPSNIRLYFARVSEAIRRYDPMLSAGILSASVSSALGIRATRQLAREGESQASGIDL